MKKRNALLIAVGILISILIVLLVPDWRRHVLGQLRGEPYVRGEPVSYWIDSLADGSGIRDQAVEALKELGPAAAPYLMRALAEAEVRKDRPKSWLRKAADSIGIDFDDPEPGESLMNDLLFELGPAAASGIAECLQDRAHVRRRAAVLLSKIPFLSPSSLKPLAKACHDSDIDVRLTAIESLGTVSFHHGRQAREAVMTLVDLLQDADGEVRHQALAALEKIGPPASPAVPALLLLLNDGDSQIWLAAVSTLGGIGEAAQPAVPALCRWATQGNRGESSAAADALGRIGALHPDVLPSLIQALQKNPAVANALRKLGPQAKPALPHLIQALKNQPSPMLFSTIEGFGPEAKEAIGPLRLLLTHHDVHFRIGAAEALWKIDGQADIVMPTILEALEQNPPWAHSLACKLGPEARAAVSILILGLTSPNPFVQSESIRALTAIGIESREAGMPLLTIAEDPKQYGQRSEAIRALGFLGLEAEFALPALVRMRSTTTEPLDVRLAAAVAIWRITGDARQAHPVLIEALDSRGLRSRVVKAIGEMPVDDQRIIDRLKQLLVDEFTIDHVDIARALWKIRREVKQLIPALSRIVAEEHYLWVKPATELLAEMGPDAKDALPALTQCLQDDDWRIRKAATQAIQKIQQPLAPEISH